jgi:hypothetical protein
MSERPRRKVERVPTLPRPPRKPADDPLAGLMRYLARNVVFLVPKEARP